MESEGFDVRELEYTETGSSVNLWSADRLRIHIDNCKITRVAIRPKCGS